MRYGALTTTGLTPAHLTALPEEPILEIKDIQGNVSPGFNKDFQTFISFRIEDAAKAKAWLVHVAPMISSMEEVLGFNRLFRALRARQGRDPAGLIATWTNIAFSYPGLKKLVPAYRQPVDMSFALGLPARSAFLGDPTGPQDEGYVENWVVGGPGSIPDILLIVASDDSSHLAAVVRQLEQSAAASGLSVLYEDAGVVRSDEPGHEQFGFDDGVSQPGVRGRISNTRNDYLTDRYIDPSDPAAAYMSRPGELLVWPGEFIFGYATQDDRDPLLPVPPAALNPPWYKNGSFVVYRRLRQDVAAFWKFMQDQAAQLAQQPGFSGMTAELLASLLVGRWPSGAPVMRSPKSDNPQLGADRLANNQFFLGVDTPSIAIAPSVHYKGDHFPMATADPLGITCPHAAHIRKVNPRDQSSEMGASGDNLIRRIIRRGLPFGTPLQNPLAPGEDPLKGNRGLIFISYQTSIEDQFEFLCNGWMNEEKRPRTPGGHDIFIGQNGTPGENRVRRCRIFAGLGASATIETAIQWVIPTGGGYFFAPSISALTDVLAAS